MYMYVEMKCIMFILLLPYVIRRVTFGPNAQMTLQSKMTLK